MFSCVQLGNVTTTVITALHGTPSHRLLYEYDMARCFDLQLRVVWWLWPESGLTQTYIAKYIESLSHVLLWHDTLYTETLSQTCIIMAWYTFLTSSCILKNTLKHYLMYYYDLIHDPDIQPCAGLWAGGGHRTSMLHDTLRHYPLYNYDMIHHPDLQLCAGVQDFEREVDTDIHCTIPLYHYDKIHYPDLQLCVGLWEGGGHRFTLQNTLSHYPCIITTWHMTLISSCVRCVGLWAWGVHRLTLQSTLSL